MTGVELDDTTAAIAQELHPDARIVARSFADYRPRGAAFDLVIGNVPFADVRLYDPVHNRPQHSIHNHFIVKSLALTRPGRAGDRAHAPATRSMRGTRPRGGR